MRPFPLSKKKTEPPLPDDGPWYHLQRFLRPNLEFFP